MIYRVNSDLCMSVRSVTLALYRSMFKTLRKLPVDSRPYYKSHFKFQFLQHKGETDTTRIKQLLARGESDRVWVEKKYTPSQPNR